MPAYNDGHLFESADIRDPELRFRDEQITKQVQLAETDLKKFFAEQALVLPISISAKRTIKTLSYSLFDNGKVLARLNYQDAITLEISVYQARIEINTAMAGVKPSDRRNQEFVNLLGLMIHHYRHYLSRAIGGWERGLQNEVTYNTKSTQDITQRGAPLPEQQEEKGGLAGLLGGAFGK